MTEQQRMAANLNRMMAHMEHDNDLPSVDTAYLTPPEGAPTQKPVLQHTELYELFRCGKILSPELREALLALPAESLLTDLAALLRFSVADYQRIEGDGNSPESWLPVHAYFLAGAMQAEGGLALLLGFLENADELLDSYFGDLLGEACWWPIFRYLPGAIDPCMELLRQTGISGPAKNVVVQAIFYAAYATPVPDVALLRQMTELAGEYVARSTETGFADAAVATTLALQLIEEADAAAQAVAKALFDVDLVRLSIAGDYDAVLEDRGKYNDEYGTLPIVTLDDVYALIGSFDGENDFTAFDDPDDFDDDDDWQPEELLYNDPAAPLYNPQLPIVKEEKVGRNEPCPCGSGKKYKKCCLGKV